MSPDPARPDPKRIAMWSGPRNLSTAMMYAFAARGDCAVWDEPFYAAYLKATGLGHPMAAEVIAAGEIDPEKVAAACLGPIPQEQSLFYQKHMTLHMIPRFDRGFMRGLTDVFLIRHPARVVASYAQKRESPTLADLGFTQQEELFDEVAQFLGHAPPVIDSADIRDNPRQALQRLCAALGIGFTENMLHWSVGPKHPSTGCGRRTGTARCIARPASPSPRDRCRSFPDASPNWRKRRCRITRRCAASRCSLVGRPQSPSRLW